MMKMSMKSYSFKFTARCPVDNALDIYDCTITSPQTIPVEKLHELIYDCCSVKKFQEDLTEQIKIECHERFRSSVTVEMIGVHSNVKVISKA
mgnify:FL=1